MKLSKILLISVLLLSGLTCVTSPVNAADDNSLVESVDKMFDETLDLFGDLKTKYTGLANNYGNIEVMDTNKVYQEYQNSIQNNKTSLEIDKKLEMIQKTDLSVDNTEMRQQFNQAKIDAAKDLSDAKLNSQAVTNKFNTIKQEQNKEQEKIEKDRITASGKKYNTIADGYKEALEKTPPKNGIKQTATGTFKASDLKYLSNSMGINFEKAIVSGKLNSTEMATVGVATTSERLATNISKRYGKR